ncbi:hypothetical protein MRB53_038851 [Persea americana]|nr:hypothetical protein MRB53_038851 [Persea americana]
MSVLTAWRKSYLAWTCQSCKLERKELPDFEMSVLSASIELPGSAMPVLPAVEAGSDSDIFILILDLLLHWPFQSTAEMDSNSASDSFLLTEQMTKAQRPDSSCVLVEGRTSGGSGNRSNRETSSCFRGECSKAVRRTIEEWSGFGKKALKVCVLRSMILKRSSVEVCCGQICNVQANVEFATLFMPLPRCAVFKSLSCHTSISFASISLFLLMIMLLPSCDVTKSLSCHSSIPPSYRT